MEKAPLRKHEMVDYPVKMLLFLVFIRACTMVLNALNKKLITDRNSKKVKHLAEESAKEREPYVKRLKEEDDKPMTEADAPLLRYKNAVLWFSRYCAEVIKMTDMMKQGEYVERRRLVYAMSMAHRYKDHLLADKKACGLGDDLTAFSIDEQFAGFKLKDGRLIKKEGADENAVFEVTRKWIKGFPLTYNAFYFEVGMRLRALDEPLTDDYYPDEWRAEWRRAKRAA